MFNYYYQTYCDVCSTIPCICNKTHTDSCDNSWTFTSYPSTAGIEEKLDRIIQLLEPEGFEEYKQEIREEIHKELLSESLEKFKELWESLARK